MLAALFLFLRMPAKLRELKLAQEDVVRLTREVQALSDGSEAVRGEHRRLQEELKSREMEEQTVGGGIGQGKCFRSRALRGTLFWDIGMA